MEGVRDNLCVEERKKGGRIGGIRLKHMNQRMFDI